MSTNKELITKVVKYLAWALPLLFIGPSLIYNGFINKENAWHYLVLGIGIAVCVASVYLIFLGLKTMMRGLFND
jgi:putative Mn2+ efflux pump MntP